MLLENNWKTKDGLTIFARLWHALDAKAVVCIVHGLGEHSGRYAHVAKFFNDHDISVLAADTRGRGRSEGKRGHTPDYETFMDDIDIFVKEAQNKYPDTPIFLHGHSMGGNLVLNYAIRRKPDFLKGVIATGPWIKLAFEPSKVMIGLGKAMRNLYPTFTQKDGLNLADLSRDTAVCEAYDKDPLVTHEITAATGADMLKAATFLENYEEKFPFPLLLMHGGDDKITSPEGSKLFYNHIKEKSDVLFKIWDGLYHEIHNEPQQSEVLKMELKWMKKEMK
ncbi:MAG: hypothetical protein RLZZ292_1821 [Bacteroidota bacterium]|jgi:alpha-beta hydrolase superfamily lysophospholipase